MHGSRPRTEILRGEMLAGDVLQVPVDVAGIDAPWNAGVIDVLKQLVTGKVAALCDDSGEPSIVDVHRMVDSALPAKLEAQHATTHPHVAVAQRRQSKGLILLHVLLVSDTNEALLEELHDRRQHFVARHTRKPEVCPRATSNARQRGGERLHAIEFRFVATDAPISVIAILLATLGITTGGLKMSAWVRADPDVAPRRRNRKRANARKLQGAPDPLPVRTDVREATWPRLAPNSRQTIVDIAQPG